MANSKRKCRYCKSYQHTNKMIKTPNSAFFCSIDHATLYAYQSKEKGRKIKHAKEKKNYQLSDLKIRKAAAIKACHAYIRERDKNNGCITCGKPLLSKYDAGHFYKSTHSYIKFMEKNINAQCVSCNQYGGGMEREYKESMIIKYGLLTVKALERCRNRKVKRSADDYIKIERYYKQKLKDLV